MHARFFAVGIEIPEVLLPCGTNKVEKENNSLTIEIVANLENEWLECVPVNI